MTTLPTWAVYAVSLGSPGLAFLGVLVAQVILRRGATELEFRSRREEVMRTLRWAAELSVSTDDRAATLGTAQLEALLDSALLDEAGRAFVRAALDAVLDDPNAADDGLDEGYEAVWLGEDSEELT